MNLIKQFFMTIYKNLQNQFTFYCDDLIINYKYKILFINIKYFLSLFKIFEFVPIKLLIYFSICYSKACKQEWYNCKLHCFALNISVHFLNGCAVLPLCQK